MEILYGRNSLKDLDETKRYVYHGSPSSGIKEFTPRNLLSRAELNGKPTQPEEAYIYATDSIDVAIFAAVVFHLGRSGWYADTDASPVKYSFNADPEIVQKAKDSIGFVYVFPKELFKLNQATQEYVTSHTVAPLYCITVGGHDVQPPLDDLKPDPNIHH